jgi:SagB-type dehydrogenase family enzyme
MNNKNQDRSLELVRAYHMRTKHRLEQYAAGPDFLDWDQQPDPFRRFDTKTSIKLPLQFDGLPNPGLAELPRQTPHIPQQDWGLEEISSLLRFSLGLAAWKVFGPDRWALRCNPSSGNLHPTEGYLIVRGLNALPDGVYHYAPYDHALELRAEIAPNTASEDNPAEIMLGLSSIAWREAWKYGERAYRYVQLDLGHAIGACAYSAALLGYFPQAIPIPKEKLAMLLGLDRDEDFNEAEGEYPDILLKLQSEAALSSPPIADDLLEAIQTARWHGHANRLSEHPRHHWPVIDEVEHVLMACSTVMQTPLADEKPPSPPPTTDQPVRQLILQRRSAQAFDGKSSLPQSTLYQILDHLLPRAHEFPWQSWPFQPRLHLILFVHRVEGLNQGLYLLPRSQHALGYLKVNMDQDFLWKRVEESPSHLPLFQLLTADSKRTARALCCHQDIAASSFFTIGMLAEFDRALEKSGPQAYPELFWEAGLIGQVLYLQAEAHGVRGTGIGCYFDDAVHEILGLGDTQIQSLYHFTVGQPKTDKRLQTLPPYQHIEEVP